MKFRRLAYFFLVLLIFCMFVSTARYSVHSWGEYENYYRYNYYKHQTLFGEDEKIIDRNTIDIEYIFYNLSVSQDSLFFRTKEYLKTFQFLNCPDWRCYNNCLYTRLDYDIETDTIALGLNISQTDNKLYIVDANGRLFGNYFEYNIPFDILEVFLTNYFWSGLFGMFLPVNSPNFFFKTGHNSSNLGSFTSFSFSNKSEFKYRGEKYPGYKMTISFEGGVYFDYKVVFENHEIEYKYNKEGVLYSFQDKGSLYSNSSDEVKLLKEQTCEMFLEEEGTHIFKTSITFIPVIVFMFCYVIKRVGKD